MGSASTIVEIDFLKWADFLHQSKDNGCLDENFGSVISDFLALIWSYVFPFLRSSPRPIRTSPSSMPRPPQLPQPLHRSHLLPLSLPLLVWAPPSSFSTAPCHWSAAPRLHRLSCIPPWVVDVHRPRPLCCQWGWRVWQGALVILDGTTRAKTQIR